MANETGTVQLVFTAERGEFRPVPDDLSKPLQVVLEVFRPDEPMSREQVASALGREPNSRLGGYLAELVKIGYLTNDEDGYWLATEG